MPETDNSLLLRVRHRAYLQWENELMKIFGVDFLISHFSIFLESWTILLINFLSVLWKDPAYKKSKSIYSEKFYEIDPGLNWKNTYKMLAIDKRSSLLGQSVSDKEQSFITLTLSLTRYKTFFFVTDGLNK